MRRLFLCDAQAGDVVEDVFVISGKQLGTTAQGKHFIKANINDRSGPMNARMWNASRDIFNSLPDAGFIKIRGRVENYQGNNQFILEQLWPAKEGTFDLADL